MSDGSRTPSYYGSDDESSEAAPQGGAVVSDPSLMFGGWTDTTTTKAAVKKVSAKPAEESYAGVASAGSLADQMHIARLQQKAKEDAYSTAAHLALLKALRPLADKHDDAFFALRAARQGMKAHCALSLQQYTEWVQQEQRRANTTPQLQYIVSILRDAVNEFSSVPLFVELCLVTNQMLEEQEESGVALTPPRIETMQALYEEAIAAVGTDFLSCHTLWTSYMDFVEDEVDDDDARCVAKAKLFKRLCCIPHAAVTDTATALQEWVAAEPLNEEAKKLVASAERALSLSQGEIEKRIPFETKLKQAEAKKDKKNTDVIKAWKEYIAFEEKIDGHKAISVALRAVAAIPWCSDMWRKVVDLQTKVGKRSAAYDTAKKAVRSLPRSSRHWIEIIRCVERCRDCTFADAVSVSKSIQDVTLLPYDRRQVQLEFLAFGRRQVAANKLDKKAFATECKRITQSLLKDDPEGAHEAASLHCHAFGRNVSAVKHAFDDLVGAKPGVLSLWQGYAREMQACGSATSEAKQEVTNVFKRGCAALSEGAEQGSSGGDGAGHLALEWLSFERFHGTAAEIDDVKDIYFEAMRRAAENRPSPVVEREEEAGEDAPKESRGAKRKRAEDEEKDRKWKERKLDLGFKQPTGPPGLSAFLVGIPFDAEEEDVRRFLKGVSIKDVRIMRKTGGASLGRAYVDVTDEDALEAALRFHNKPLGMKGQRPRKVMVHRSEPERVSKSAEEVEASKLEKRKKAQGRFRGDPASSSTTPAAAPAAGGQGQDFFKNLLKK